MSPDVVLEVDLHIHSHHSFDGAMTPAAIVQRARTLGLAAVAITDHEAIAGAFEGRAVGDALGLEVIVGMEVHTEIGDLLGLFVAERVRSCQAREFIDEVHEQGGIVVLPHPYHHHAALPSSILKKLDAVEEVNGRVPLGDECRIVRELASVYSLSRLGSSDAHWLSEIGSARTLLRAASSSPNDLRRAICGGETSAIRFRRGSTRATVLSSKLLKRTRRLVSDAHP